MKPFEAIGALALGLAVYFVMQFFYHATTGTPALWRLELFGLLSFVVGALLTRYLWR